MRGYFIVSLDCEGKWGMADKLQPYHHRVLTDSALAEAYHELSRLFERYDIPATFAFVMALTLTAEERARFAHLFAADTELGGWMSHFHAAQREGNVSGWFQPRALDVIRKSARHEIACHGFCHRPLANSAISAAGARAELEAASEIARAKGLSLKTFVFPRNQVGHVSALMQAGYIGYRDEKPRRPGRLGRLQSLAEEFDLWPQPEVQKPSFEGKIVPIPAGHFFNWRFGARRRVPTTITIQRWKTLLERTATGGGVAHLWFHPHNLVTAPDTKQTLEAVLAHAANLCASGRLKAVTQEAYCRELIDGAVGALGYTYES